MRAIPIVTAVIAATGNVHAKITKVLIQRLLAVLLARLTIGAIVVKRRYSRQRSILPVPLGRAELEEPVPYETSLQFI
jgi:hypothetical protein